MKILSVFALGGALAVAAAAPVSAGERLTTRAIKSLFPGQFHAVVKGYKVEFVARGDGFLRGTYKLASDEGRWSIRRGRLCIMLKDWTNGKTNCSAVIHADGWYKANDVKFRKL